MGCDKFTSVIISKNHVLRINISAFKDRNKGVKYESQSIQKPGGALFPQKPSFKESFGGSGLVLFCSGGGYAI
jgi:hypothetical protein